MAKTGTELLAEQREELKKQGKNTRQMGKERILYALDWVCLLYTSPSPRD